MKRNGGLFSGGFLFVGEITDFDHAIEHDTENLSNKNVLQYNFYGSQINRLKIAFLNVLSFFV